MNYKKALFLFLFLSITIPQVSLADSVVRTGETVSVESDNRIEGDFYTAASVLSISGQVAQDLISVGGRSTLNGSVGGDALMIGGSVDVHGPVGDDLRVVAGDVIIAEPITGDVFVMGGSVKVLSTASIGGDLIVYGGDVEVSGSVGGDIVGTIESLRIDAPVAGLVDVTVPKLVLGDRADITGSLQYVSSEQLTRSPNAKVGGEITRNDVVKKDAEYSPAKVAFIFILIALFSSLMWYLLARTILTKIVNRALTQSIRPVLLGFITFFAAPVIIVILTVSVLGTFVGLASFFAYMLLLFITVMSMSAVIGVLALRQYKKKTIVAVTPLSLLLGVSLLAIALVIPVVGPILFLGLFLVTMGAIADLLLRP
jgi:hypothetical protein